MAEALEVRVLRSGRRESFHEVHAVAVRADGGTARYHGDPDLEAFWRSSMKPFQALPLVEDGVTRSLGASSEELALCCGSHTGSREHVEVVRRLLGRLGLGEGDLACGPDRPLGEEEAARVLREGGTYGSLHNNCSGKHAGMLALALHHGWDLEGYHEPEHAVQARIRASLEAWIGRPADSLAWGVDGCGVPTPCLGLREMAAAYAGLGRAARGGDGAPAAVVVGAMTAHPHLVAGSGRTATRVMEATSGRILAKGGAEGVLCMTIPEEGLGLAVKVVDGARRATAPAALRVLEELDLLGTPELDAMEDLRRVVVRNTRGDPVGRIEAPGAPAGAGR